MHPIEVQYSKEGSRDWVFLATLFYVSVYSQTQNSVKGSARVNSK